MQTAINVNPSQISLNADDIRIKDAGGIITANDVEGALQENRLKLNAHIAGTADKHAADKINYSGNVTGVSDVKAAIDRLQTNINNISMTGSQHDALVTAALIDVENENFNTAEKGYLNGRLEKWEQRTKAIENDIQEGKTAELIIDGGIGTLPDTAVKGQVSVTVKGRTWNNRAGAGDTSPQTIENLDSTKTYLLIKTDGGTVNVDGDDINVPAKITGKTSITLTWASGKIALYELSTEEAALTEAELGARYHYVDGTKSTLSAIRVMSVGKNILGGEKFAQSVIKAVGSPTHAYKTTVDNRNVLALVGGSAVLGKTVFDKFKENTQYTLQVYAKRGEAIDGGIFQFLYTDGTTQTLYPSTSWKKTVVTSYAGKTIRALVTFYGSAGKINYYDIDTFQIEEGTTATEYEPYKEDAIYITAKNPETGEILELRSLPNGVKDEVRISEGKLIKRIGEKTNVASGAVINYADMADNGTYYAWNDDGETETGVKGDTLGIDATELIYQLAQPIESNVPAQEISAGPGDTVMWLPHKKDKGLYTETGFIISDQSLPIKSLISVKKKDLATGQDVDIDLSTCIVAGDGLSFTSSALVEGDSIVCVYEYDDSLGTIPQIVVKYNNNFKAQTESNTEAIQRNNKAILSIQDRLDLMYAELDFRLTLLELAGGEE